MHTIDLRSDTVTRPSDEMRQVMAQAVVGDDVLGDDPTVKELQDHVANLFGREAALFVPSGTMGNQLCLVAHAQPGWEMLCERECHIINYEAGGPAVHANLLVNLITTPYGMITAEMVRCPRTRSSACGPCAMSLDSPSISMAHVFGMPTWQLGYPWQS